MIATLLLDQLLAAAARVGVELRRIPSDGNLYIWHTPEGEVVYIGKSGSNRRVTNEAEWSKLHPREWTYSGIVMLLRANKAQVQPLHYEPATFDGTKWKLILDQQGWGGTAFDKLAVTLGSGEAPTVEEIEKLLVRIAVRYGTPIGNSQFASQWEAPIGSTSDSLAALAAISDPDFFPLTGQDSAV
ncbi:hypothetical protein [Nocardia brevicatena]|uniref:hypothetical protein n=1 Tax=Nocardia brevicatena TaxID=37327 RepID=UPI0002EC3639|nr:hypothetical protein [Nocardia brevicatena]